VAVITGAGGRAFCVGTDLKVRAKTGEDDFPETGFAGLTHRFDLDKPIIAAVNGLALGGGLEMMLAADIVIAADHAEFGFPEPKVGLAALGGGGIQRLTRQIPYKQAMGLLLTGSRINADEAQKWGLINQVVPAEHLQEAVDYWVADMLDCAPLALKATKQIAQQSLDYRTLEEALQAKYPAATDMENSADALEGPKAFAEKRKPCWRAK
ncbi:MAG: enoyl-CoA hydratase-related protein, partial [Chloroflexota bacterium]